MIKKKYILFVTPSFKNPEQNGVAGGNISNYLMISALAKLSTVKVLSFDSRINAEKKFTKDGIEVTNIPLPRWNRLQFILGWVNHLKKHTKLYIQDNGLPCHFIVTSSCLPALEVVYEENKIKTWIIVRAFENFGLFPPNDTFKNRINILKSSIVNKFGDKKIFKLADAVIANSVYVKHAIEKRFCINGNRIEVLYPPCDIVNSKKTTDCIERSVGFVMRDSGKNLSLVIEIARRLPEWIFFIYGHTENITCKFPANVILKGFTSDRVMMLNSAKIWIMPSKWQEPFGRVSVEAQTVNRAVLVANVGGLPETVLDDRFIIKGFKVEDWVSGILEVAKLTSSEIEQNGLKIIEKFGLEAHNKMLKQIFLKKIT